MAELRTMGIFTSTRATERESTKVESSISQLQSLEPKETCTNSQDYDPTDQVFSGSRGAPVSGLFEDLTPTPVSSVSHGDGASSEQKVGSFRDRLASLGESLSAYSYFNAKGVAASSLTVIGLLSPALYFPALVGAGALLGWGADKALAPIFKERSETKGFDIKRKVASWVFSAKDTQKNELSEVGKFLVEHDSLGPKVLGMVTLAGLGVASGGILGMAALIGAGAAAYFVTKPGAEKPVVPRLAGAVCLAGMAAAYVGMAGLGMLAFSGGVSVLIAKPLISIVSENVLRSTKKMEAK
jgi:hypothetical protein